MSTYNYLDKAGLSIVWDKVKGRITSAISSLVSGPSSATSGNVAIFNGTTGKVIKDSGVAVNGLSTATNWTNGSSVGSVRTIGGAVEDSSYTIGMYATAEGWNTKASGLRAHAEGYDTLASGLMSHAEGQSTIASGRNAHAEGLKTIANHASQHVFGEYNTEDVHANGVGARGTYVEIVGNGTSTDSRSNARTLDWEGNEVLSGSMTVGAKAKLQYNSTTEALDFIFV